MGAKTTQKQKMPHQWAEKKKRTGPKSLGGGQWGGFDYLTEDAVSKKKNKNQSFTLFKEGKGKGVHLITF